MSMFKMMLTDEMSHPATMTKRARSPAEPLMTLGNMRANGVRSLTVSCWQCHYSFLSAGGVATMPCLNIFLTHCSIFSPISVKTR
jgi:hypothetical protein